MFSLCIPTMDRFDQFLSINLVNYLENEYIHEIIITDENGKDIEKIKSAFPNNDKLVLVKNEKQLGPFSNKLKVCSLAKNEWIVLMDSDNFANKEYFKIAYDYIVTLGNQKNIILAPCKAQPNFDYSHLSGFIYKKDSFSKNNQLENQIKQPHNTSSDVLMNTGNYVINKYLIDNLNLSNEENTLSPCDVIYFNTLLFEQLDLHMHVVSNLVYDHVVHNGSTYIQTAHNYHHFNEAIHKRYYNLV